ncbi:MAG: NAD(P)-dependent oxidoreductase [Pirellulaceae bacterium]|nr:NAD(P)-dependent oxidoreductase [Pirellulaceae bacterium]
MQPCDIAFIGTGVMGASMAGHLLRAGHRLHVYNRTRHKANTLVEAGARWHDGFAPAAGAADVVITMLGFPDDVQAAYLGSNGIVAHARPGALLIDMTTSSPRLAQQIAQAAQRRDLMALDAPVSGGDIGAREARLVIMVGGVQAAFERAKPLFELMGQHIALLGPAGSGQHCKLANQIAGAIGMLAWCEALAYADRAGLDAAAVQACVAGGAAGSWAMTNLAPRALQGNFQPGFYVKHILKDIGIALESAAQLGLELPGMQEAQRQYERVVGMGWENLGTQALYRLYTES